MYADNYYFEGRLENYNTVRGRQGDLKTGVHL